MKIIHVNNVDLTGNRFNGHDMQVALNKRGIGAKQFVMDKLGDDPNTIPLTYPYEEPFLRSRCMKFEREQSIHALIYPYLWRLLKHPDFKAADVVHYHLLHNYFGSLAAFPAMTREKPSVLTIHDPWIFSGHCIYSLDCDRWKSGCGDCPRLDLIFPMEMDNTARMWEIKRQVFRRLDVDIVVASEYMMELVKQSPITSHLENVHLIPFGIDIGLFTQEKASESIRKRLKIPKENFVIFFRQDPSPYKGISYIKDMLEQLPASKAVTILTVGHQGLLSKYAKKFQLIEKEWINDNHMIADLYAACDVFLMPSTAEAFGLMAIEAMASGRPVVVLEGTSLPGVTFAPDCGIALPREQSGALAETVQRLMKNPEECRRRGELGRKLAKQHYRFEDYIERHIELYEDILKRNRVKGGQK